MTTPANADIYTIPNGIAYPHCNSNSAGETIIREAKDAGLTAGQHLASVIRHAGNHTDAAARYGIDATTLGHYMLKFGIEEKGICVPFGWKVVIKRTALPTAARPTATEV